MNTQEKVIVIQGCPGTGKTTISERLSKILNAKHIDLSKLVIEEKLFIDFDVERGSYIPDMDLLLKKINKLISESDSLLIIEGHYADVVPPQYVYKAFVLRMHPSELEKRLEKKGWSKRKIHENILAEMLNSCLISALEVYGDDKVIEIDVTNKETDEIIKEILDALSKKNYKTNKYIDWLKILEEEGILEKYLTMFSSSKT